MSDETTAPPPTPEHEAYEAMKQLGQTSLELDTKIVHEQSAEAVIKADLAKKREEIRTLEAEREETRNQLAIIAAGKNSELLPFKKTKLANAANSGMPVIPKLGDPYPGAVDPDAWKTVRLDSLKRPKPLTKGKLEILAGHSPSIVTLGDLAAYANQPGVGQFWGKNIKGFGKGGQQTLEELREQYFADNPQPDGKNPAIGQPGETGPKETKADAEPEVCPPLEWGPGDSGEQKRANSVIGTEAAPFFFTVTIVEGGQHIVGGSPEVMYDPQPSPFASDTAAMYWCDGRNAEVFAEAQKMDAPPATPTGTPEAAAGAAVPNIRLAPSGKPAVTETAAAEKLGLIGKDALTDPEYAALRVGAYHAAGIIQGAAAGITKSLWDKGLCDPDNMGEPRITNRGLAVLGFQPELDNELFQMAGKKPEPTIEPADETPPAADAIPGEAAPAQPKRGRGRPKGSGNKPKAEAAAVAQ